MIERVLKSVEDRRAESLDGLREFLRIPSVSTKPEHRQDMQRCATWLADQPLRAVARGRLNPHTLNWRSRSNGSRPPVRRP